MNNLHVDLDERIVKYVFEKTNLNITKKTHEIVCFALKEQNILVDDIYISINSVSKDEIKKINKEYRNIDKETDVLSFPIFEKDEYEKIVLQKNQKKKIRELELGDIFICLDVVYEHSKEYGTGILREILYMITHGVSHLLGFDHIEDNDKKQMREFEEKILDKLGVNKLDEK